MDRLACVDLPAFPLQMLLGSHPDWRGLPAAVVDKDTPQGVLLWVNEHAWRSRIRPGLRYAAALSIDRNLRAGIISAGEIEAEVTELGERLRGFSPHVEPSNDEPGVFWLDASGLELLFPDLEGWAQTICTDLGRAGYRSTAVVGFTRFGTYAAARAGLATTSKASARSKTASRSRNTLTPATLVFKSSHEEREAGCGVRLERLDVEPRTRDALLRLGVRTVGDLARLPAGGLRKRFGEDAHRLYRMATGQAWSPLVPVPPEEPIREKTILDEAVTDTSSLLFLTRRMLGPMLATLASKEEALAEIRLTLELDKRPNTKNTSLEEALRPAAPTLDETLILDLVRLRLEALELAAGIVELTVEAVGLPASREQLRLFAAKPRRDLQAANRALARLRAELGEKAVLHARLRDGHLPEASFAWEPLTSLQAAEPRNVRARPLVRRIQARPAPMATPSRHERDKEWSVSRAGHGRIESFIGPYILSGGWWHREIHREYHFALTEHGELLWIYYDKRRRHWFVHGRVE